MGIYLPVLNELNSYRDMVGEFRGYNHNLRIGEGEFYNETNMSADLYPVMSPRARRAKVRSFTKPNGLFAHNKLCWVDGTSFYYDGELVDGFELADSPKTFVGMGAYILIWPDKVYYNTSDGTFGTLGNKVVTDTEVTASLCKVDGTVYDEYDVSDTAPSDPSDGDLWLDTSKIPHVLRQFSNTQAMWVSIPTTYVKIAATGIGAGFSEYDGVTISGFVEEALNGEKILEAVGEDYIVITAIIDETVTQEDAVTVERVIPDMDFITESENRVWGCSSEKHEIYACKQGDPKNWKYFTPISTASYAMTVGSPGDFTGCCTHLGYVMFFKEDIIHKIYGNQPSNYQLTNVTARGIEKGSEKSIAIVNEVLLYKSKHDICAYNSSLPQSISEPLGKERYKNAVAGALGPKYYVCVEDYRGNHALFVYDTARGIWHKEDDVNATYFAALGKDLYFINNTDKCMYSIAGDVVSYADETAALEGPIEWSAETGDIGLDSPDNKYISKLQFRVDIDNGAVMRIAVAYDGSSDFEERYVLNGTHKRSHTVPIIPRRCDTMRIRLSGRGDCKLYSLTKTIEQGSEA